jgi:hypothetical protein
MFIFTAKLSIKRLVAGLGIICCVVFGVVTLADRDNGNAGVFFEEETQEVLSLEAKGLKTTEDMKAYIESIGWQVSDNIQSKTVLIPKEFTGEYEQYNVIQKEQGFDLSKYKGKKVMLVTFEVLNYKDVPEGVTANILLYKNKVIGGDICLETEEGFIHGLAEGLE